MAEIYVDSGAGGTPDGLAWSTAWTRMYSDTVTFSPGDIVYVDSTHLDQENTVNVTVTDDGSTDPDNPIIFISCTNPGSDTVPTTYAAGARLYTPNVDTIGLLFNGCSAVFIGFTFDFGNTITLGTDSYLKFYDCTFVHPSNNARDISIASGAQVEMYNCTIKFTNANSSIPMGFASMIRMVNTDLDATGTKITNVFDAATDNVNIELIGCDLSNSSNIISDSSGTIPNGAQHIRAWNTKFGDGSIASGGIGSPGTRVEGFGLSSGTDFDAVHIEDWAGTTNEDTGIYLDATQDGTTGYSLKSVATGDAEPGVIGHRYQLGQFYNSDATNPQVTVELMTTDATSAATLTDQEFWIEIIATDSTGPPGLHVDGVPTNYILGSGTTLTSSSKGAGDWTGELSSTNYYKVTETVTGGAAGMYAVYVNFAPSSVKTVYVDPFITVT